MTLIEIRRTKILCYSYASLYDQENQIAAYHRLHSVFHKMHFFYLQMFELNRLFHLHTVEFYAYSSLVRTTTIYQMDYLQRTVNSIFFAIKYGYCGGVMDTFHNRIWLCSVETVNVVLEFAFHEQHHNPFYIPISVRIFHFVPSTNSLEHQGFCSYTIMNFY